MSIHHELLFQNPARVDRLTRIMMLLYRLASFYGSSYRRAFLVLLFLILGVFPATYMLPIAHFRERALPRICGPALRTGTRTRNQPENTSGWR